MGRNTKEKNLLTKKVLSFLLDTETTKEKLKVCFMTLDSLSRSRSSTRRKHFRDQMELIFQNLCVHSTDKEMYIKRFLKVKSDFSKESSRRSELQTHVITLERRISELKEVEGRLAEETTSKFAAEADYGKMLRENENLKKQILNLKERLKAREKHDTLPVPNGFSSDPC